MPRRSDGGPGQPGPSAAVAPLEQVRDALAHLYDPGRLQTHPLAARLDGADRTGRGRALQRALLDAVDALKPSRDGKPGPRALRRHRLLQRRYVDGLGPEAVQAELLIGRSEYYRAHQEALEAVASLLRERLGTALGPAPAPAVASDVGGRPADTADAAASPPAETATARPPGARPTNLPRQLTSFVGREREVAELAALVAVSPLVTLAGPGGVGKTRLALAVGERAAQPLGGGAELAELAALTDEALVPTAVAAALGVPVLRDPLEALTRWLGAGPTLLVLDNCEHVVGACAGLLDPLLRACPELRVLATSREPLGVAGEVVWHLSPLEPEPAAALFALRAAAARPGFAVTPANRDAVARVCARLDGLPLAIELAAARVRALSPAEIADRLDEALDLLAASGRSAPARHQTLRAAVDWSHGLLAENERRLLRRLSVFAGWFDLAAAEAVGGATAGLLARLVDRSLVEADPRDEVTRFRLLETLRRYAAERLTEAGEETMLRDRHLAHYLALGEAVEPGLWSDGERVGVERLEAAHDNVRAALDRGLAADPERALRLAAAVWCFWRLRGHHYEGRGWLRAALEAAPADAPTRAHALAAAATLARDLGEPEEMKRLADEALRLAEATGDHRSAGFALLSLGAAAEPGEVEALTHRMLEHYRAADFGWGVAAAFSTLGIIALRRGDVAAAQAPLEEALAEARRIGNPQSETSCLFYLAMATYGAGQLERTLALLDQAEPIALTTSVLGAGRTIWQARGWVLLDRGDLRGAVAMFRAAVSDQTPAGRALPPMATAGSPLFWLGAALLQGGEEQRGVRLMAAGYAAARNPPARWVGMGPGRERVDALVEAAKAALPPVRFAALWAEGQALASDDAIAQALGETT